MIIVKMKAFFVVALFICAANAAVLVPVLDDEEVEKGLPAFRLDPEDADDVLMKALPELEDFTNKDRDEKDHSHEDHEKHHDDPAHNHGNHGVDRDGWDAHEGYVVSGPDGSNITTTETN